MSEEGPPASPSLAWRLGSSITMGVTGILARTFLVGASRLEVHGLEEFLGVLKEREDVEGRQRGLISVSNHLSVLDDPGMWGALPYRVHWSPNSNRWSLGSHDLMFKNPATSLFFSLGQCLPTHRLHHSRHGGLFQPTMTEIIKLLSARPFTQQPSDDIVTPDISDPFSSAQLTYTTTGHDIIPSPSAYLSRRHAWVHIFPEGRIHQKSDQTMRYFKWGVSRLILESEPCPDLVPIWIEGFDQIMHESREFPRFLPRPGKSASVTFGQRVNMEKVFGDLRDRWKSICETDKMAEKDKSGQRAELGLLSDRLKYGQDAVRLREECTMRVREEVLNLRRERGWTDEDPKARLVDTWREEGSKKRDGQMADGSWVRDT